MAGRSIIYYFAPHMLSSCMSLDKHRIIETLMKVGCITTMQAELRGINSLRSHIYELRKQGYDIETVLYHRKNDGRKVAKYTLTK